MILPPIDIDHIAEAFQESAVEVVEAFEDIGPTREPSEKSPAVLADAMLRLIEVLKLVDVGGPYPCDEPGGGSDEGPLCGHDVRELGDYGINLLTELAAVASDLHLERHSDQLVLLTFPLAVWVARHGGELNTLEPVVNALAQLANRITEPHELEQLFALICELLDAVNPMLQSDLDRSNPGRPWRLLLLNRAIIATRTHKPPLMERAFRSITEFLPEDAPEFFREGMEQMDAVGYPQHVREVVERYFQQWSVRRTLH